MRGSEEAIVQGPVPVTRATEVLPSLAQRWYVLIMMVLVYTMSIADRYSISTVQESIRLELHLTDAGIGALAGVTLAFFYVVMGFPISWLIDRRNRRNIIAISVGLWSIMTAFTGMAASYWQLFMARIGVGVGEAGGTPGANSLLSDYFPVDRRPMALTIFGLGAPIGAWIAASVAGAIADQYGWRMVFLALGIPGAALALLIWVTVREPRRGQFDAAEEVGTATFFESMKFLWLQRSCVHLMLGSAVTALWGWGLMWWTPTYLQRSFGLTAGQAGEIIGPINLWAGMGATLATGWLLSSRLMCNPRRIVILMGTVIGLVTIPSIVIFWTHSLELAKIMFWIFIPAIYFYIGPCFGIINNLAQPRMRAVFCATTLFVANVGNLILAPGMVGLLSDWFAPNHIADAASLRSALLVLAPTGFWAAFHYFWCARNVCSDQERATGVKVQE
jgi:predicted MFS family arabinose efflux permease